MSEDEIIERVNHFVNIHVLYGKTYAMTTDDLTEYQQVFRGLLDLYQQEKEKNEELNQIKCGIKILQNNGLDDEQYIVIANKNLKNTSYKNLLDDYVSKDKIKKKRDKLIKDAKELTINIGGRGCGKTFQQAVHNENIKLLNELLEEKKL